MIHLILIFNLLILIYITLEDFIIRFDMHILSNLI